MVLWKTERFIYICVFFKLVRYWDGQGIECQQAHDLLGQGCGRHSDAPIKINMQNDLSTNAQSGNRECFHLLVHSSNALNSQDQTRLMPQAKYCKCVYHLGGKKPIIFHFLSALGGN